MNDTAIRVDHLSKLYRIGRSQVPYKTLRDTVADLSLRVSKFIRRPFFRRSASDSAHSNDTIWALKDVSFEVKRGEVVGIIGRNGAGKSTLLKILSRITEPTEGYAEIYGRVGSLLEVGTGFHPELTGRENIYLNAAILGMKKHEIQRKFDEIVSFAEIEKFLDTPVKHYSSGMYVRLAFAVAAHLDPEILLVDEVLAVGDAAFQKKCLGKMSGVAKDGRTVFFVSHNMAAVNRLCHWGIWLENGQIALRGEVENVVASYIGGDAKNEGERSWRSAQDSPGNEKLRLRGIRILNSVHKVTSSVDIRKPFFVEITYELFRTLPSIRVAFQLVRGDGTVVFTSSDSEDGLWQGKVRQKGVYTSRCEIPGNFLNEGQYTLTVSADLPFVEKICIVENVLSFHVDQTGGVSGRFPEKWAGVICPKLAWQIEPLERQSHEKASQ
jgi:lipopolysaccharide transport system ATP-binding protein